jgi:FMN-dependent NADH-azoreductase
MGTRLLYVKASPRKNRSRSIAVAEAFLDVFGQTHEDAEVDRVDLFETDLPAFDGPAMEAKYAIMRAESPTPGQKKAWSRVEEVIDRFTAADRYVLAVPMWNFSIPYRLKQYIDVLVQPGYTFQVTDSGYQGLLNDKAAFVAYARGGDYSAPPADAMDFQKPYLEAILGFMGITAVSSAIVQPVLMGGPEQGQAALQAAIDRARSLARDF